MTTSNSKELIERGRARILRDVDPAIVAESRERKAAWAKMLGNPKRCETNEVHPGLGCCLFCGAESGENCRARATQSPVEGGR